MCKEQRISQANVQRCGYKHRRFRFSPGPGVQTPTTFQVQGSRPPPLFRGSVVDRESLRKRGGAETNVSAPSSFIANVHNELYAYAFKAGKDGLLKKIPSKYGEGTAAPTPLNPPLYCRFDHNSLCRGEKVINVAPACSHHFPT